MDGPQSAAFQSAAQVAPDQLRLAIAGVAATATLLWLVWTALAMYKLWHAGELTSYDFIWHLLRASIVVMTLGWVIR